MKDSICTVSLTGHTYGIWYPYLQWHFIIAELHRLDCRFGHLSADKISNSLRLTELNNKPDHTIATLVTVTGQRDPFQRYAQDTRQLKSKIKDNFVFKHILYADVFDIKKRKPFYTSSTKQLTTMQHPACSI